MIIKDKEFETLISERELQDIVRRLADKVSLDYAGRNPVICPVLTGAFVFAADLVRRLTVPCEMHFVCYTSYSGIRSTGEVHCSLPFSACVAGRDVLIVEDVVDSGFSMQHVLQSLAAMHPASVRVCTLLFKPHAFKGDFSVDYVGRNIANEFVVGYGLDYDGYGRNLPEILQATSAIAK